MWDDSPWKVVPVNGANLCEDLAWKYGRSKPKKINQETAWNADNYAWYLVSRWFNRRMKGDVRHDELMVVNGYTTTGSAPFQRYKHESSSRLGKRDSSRLPCCST